MSAFPFENPSQNTLHKALWKFFANAWPKMAISDFSYGSISMAMPWNIHNQQEDCLILLLPLSAICRLRSNFADSDEINMHRSGSTASLTIFVRSSLFAFLHSFAAFYGRWLSAVLCIEFHSEKRRKERKIPGKGECTRRERDRERKRE